MPASLRSDGVRVHPGMPFGFLPEYTFSFPGIPNMFEMPIIRAVGTYFSLSELAMMRHSGVMP
jgi:hypothetical protein